MGGFGGAKAFVAFIREDAKTARDHDRRAGYITRISWLAAPLPPPFDSHLASLGSSSGPERVVQSGRSKLVPCCRVRTMRDVDFGKMVSSY